MTVRIPVNECFDVRSFNIPQSAKRWIITDMGACSVSLVWISYFNIFTSSSWNNFYILNSAFTWRLMLWWVSDEKLSDWRHCGTNFIAIEGSRIISCDIDGPIFIDVTQHLSLRNTLSGTTWKCDEANIIETLTIFLCETHGRKNARKRLLKEA